MPTGTRNDGSGIGQPATEDDSLIPPETKRWLNEAILSEEGNALFLDDALNECAVLSVLWWSTPDFKAVSYRRFEKTGSEQCAARSTSAEKKQTRSHLISFLAIGWLRPYVR